jgi:membrane associated rhomboid family serine protease
MRDEYPQERSSVLVWLLCALVAGFLLQNVMQRWLGVGSLMDDFFALSPEGIRHYRFWMFLSYSFLHDTDNLLHILFILITLYFVGREVLTTLGNKRFLILYSAASIAGGLLWLAMHSHAHSQLIGASAAVTGLFFFFVCLYPDRPITFLFLFIPITLPKTKYLGYAVAFLDLFGLAFWEFRSTGYSVAHSAHLGGMLVGLGYYQLFHKGFRFPKIFRRSKVEVIPPAWAGKAKVLTGQDASIHFTVNTRERLKAEVDRILDKINSKGFASLTPEEKRILDEARDLLNRN